MKLKFRFTIAILTTIMSLSALWGASGEMDGLYMNGQSLSKQLRQSDAKTRARIAEEYRAARLSEMTALLAVLADAADDLQGGERIDMGSPEAYAIRILGESRFLEATDALIKLIAVRDSAFSPVSNQKNPHWRAFPCAIALAQIGVPAINPLLDRIRSAPPKSTTFNIGCVTLEAMLGKHLATEAVRNCAKNHPEFAHSGKLDTAIKAIRVGHVDWNAMESEDFRLE